MTRARRRAPRTIRRVDGAPIEVGTPAAHAARLAAAARNSAVAAGATSAALAVMSLLALGSWPLGALVGLAAAATGMWWAQQRSVAHAKAVAGVRAEQRVADQLRRIHPTGVAHGVLLGGGGDADHVAVGPFCVLVETKHGKGPLRVSDGRVSVGGRALHGDPISQATRQAAALRRTASVYVDAVLCIVDMDGPPERHRSVTVCSAADLPAVVASSPAVLDERAARRLLFALASKTDDGAAPAGPVPNL